MSWTKKPYNLIYCPGPREQILAGASSPVRPSRGLDFPKWEEQPLLAFLARRIFASSTKIKPKRKKEEKDGLT